MTYDSTIENLVDAVELHFSTHIGSYVEAVNSGAAKASTLKPIRKVETSDADPYGGSDFPRIQLYVQSLETEQVSTGFAQAAMSFAAVVAINDGSEQRLRLLRYAEAMRQVLRDYHELGQSDFDVDPRGMTITYYPTDPSVGIGVAKIDFRVIKDIPA